MNLLRKIDWFLVIPAGYLVVLGLVIQYSIMFKSKGVEIDLDIVTQSLSLAFAVLVSALLFKTRSDFIRRFAWLPYLVSLVLLGLVLLIGTEAGGAQRWISVGNWQLQPTEVAKLALILMAARVLDTKQKAANRLRHLAYVILLVAAPAALVGLQPDLGSAVVFGAIWFGMLFVSKMQLSRLAFLSVAIVTTALLLIPFLAEYQQQRLVSYFNPNQDTQGANYNVTQAKIAIGTGGIYGTGLESGTQSQLNFLPSQHTDFIFAVTAEKLGLIGAGSILLAYLALFTRCLYIAWATDKQYEKLVVVGVVSLLIFHVFVNIGMNLGLVPVTGLPLPLLSYGGTFMFVTVTAIGIVNYYSAQMRIRKSHATWH